MNFIRHRGWLVAAALFVVLLAIIAALDPSIAAGAALIVANAPIAAGELDVLKKALAEYGQNIKAAVEKMTEHSERLADLEKRTAHKWADAPGAGLGGPGATAELAELVVNSDGAKGFAAGHSPMARITVPHRLFAAAITNVPGQNQPLVPAQRVPGIVETPRQRLTIRNLYSAMPATSNLIEFCRELVVTNNAGPQYDATSPDPHQEGAQKNESGITFELATAALTTIAHWIPASRQVLKDAPMLQRYLDDKMMYLLKLEEEDELINGSGSAGELSGLIVNSTAFTGGATNQTILDTLARAWSQLYVANLFASGIILHPSDWLSIMLLKDTQNRYLIGDPQTMAQPRLWGLPVVLCPSLAQGKFLVLDAPASGYIADRDEAEVRLSESHADFFVRNMVAILCEERTALVIERSAAIIYGDLNYTG